MANTSILAAFERMWQHISSALSNKSDADHSHSDATQAASGFLSAEDKTQLDYGGIPIVTASSSDGVTYTATIDGMSALTIGMKFTIVPSANSTSTSPKLNLNSLGGKYIRMPIAYNSSATSAGALDSWIVKNKPITLEYDGTYFRTISMPRPSALYLYGSVPVANGGTGATTAEDALVNLGITATATELNYIDGVTSNVQTQLDGKAASSHNHSASNITSGSLGVARGGTGATDAATARTNLEITPANIGAVSTSGDTISGDLILGDGENTAQHDLYIRRTMDEVLKSGRLYWGTGGVLRLQAASAGTAFNYMDLKPDSTAFKQPVTIASGGTGSANGATGLKNLFAAGSTVLSSHQYGTSLPTAGTAGRIFFKKVSS